MLQKLKERPEGLNHVNGGIEYVVKRDIRKGTKRICTKTYGIIYGENKIWEYKDWEVSEIIIDFWNKPPVFNTFMQAVMWLKKNKELLA